MYYILNILHAYRMHVCIFCVYRKSVLQCDMMEKIGETYGENADGQHPLGIFGGFKPDHIQV